MDQAESVVSPDPYVALAERAVRKYVTERRVVGPPLDPPSEMLGTAGVFVSIKKQGALRGCIGTFFPTEATIAEEIVANAIKSATSDPRFPPIGADELDDLTLSVDVLSKPQPCTEDDLDPARFGIIVESGWRRGLLLPALDGVDSVAQQVDIARRKAGIGPDEPVELRRFTVERHA